MYQNKSSFAKTLGITMAVILGSLIVLLAIMYFLADIKKHKSSPSSSKSCLSKVRKYFNEGYDDLAEEKAKQCLKKDPKNKDLILIYADILAGQKKYDEALKQYDKYMKLDPDKVDIIVEAASIYDNKKDFKSSAKLLKKAVKLAPRNEMANNNLCWVLAEDKKYKEALPYCKKALEISPGKAYIIDSMGYTLAGLGKTDEAIEYYEEAVSIDPTEPEQHLHLADAYMIKKQGDLALEHFNKYLELAPDGDKVKEVQSKIDKLTKTEKAS